MPSMNINAGAQGNPLDQLIAQNKGNLWGSSGGMMYQYGRDSTGRDTFGPGTAEDGTPLGNQDGSMIGSQDARHGALSQALGKYGPGWVQIRNTNIGGPGGVRDPGSVRYDPVAGLVTHSSNLNPMADDTGRRIAMVLAPALGGMALGGLSGAGLGASYGDSISALAGGAGGAGGASGSIVGNAEMPGYAGTFDAEGTAGLSGSTGGLPNSYWTQLANSGQLGNDGVEVADGLSGGSNGLASTSGGYGGLDPETASGQFGGMGVSQNGIGPGSLGNTLQGVMNNPSSLLNSEGALGRAGSSLGSSIASHPFQAARVAGGLYALGSAGSSSGGNSSGGNGSLTDPQSIINAMADANRVNQTTPFGARTWSQDPTSGRWSVADTMSPEEQANYENVRGMNADVTGMARQRLAALMSKPASARADRPIDFRLHGG